MEEDTIDVDALLASLEAKNVSVHQIVWQGNLDKFKKIVDETPEAKEAEDQTLWGQGFRPLHYAAYAGHENIVKYLIEQGVKLDTRTFAGCTALFYASQQGHVDCVKALLDAQANVNITSEQNHLFPVDVATEEEVLELFRQKFGGEKTYKPQTPDPPKIVGVSVSSLMISWINDTTTASPTGSILRYDLRVETFGDDGSESSIITELAL